MRKIQRLAAVGAMAALAISVAACSNSEKASTSTGAPVTPSAAASANGVTTPNQVFGAACSALPQGDAAGGLMAMGPQPVASAASTNPLLTNLVAAVKATNLVDTLNNAPALTVYAPADSAFAALGADTVKSLLADPSKLAPILQYHVTATRYDKDDLIKAGTTTSLAGGTVKVAASGDTLALTDGKGNTATVLCGNIPTKNATVFVINKVLQPAG